MKLPKKIRVGNITYTINMGDKYQKELDDMNTEGYHCGSKQIIALSNNLSEEMLRNTFFHEVTHALLYQIGAIKQHHNELFVQSLANELDKLFELK